MEILFSELLLLFEVSLFWVEVEDEGLLLIVLSVAMTLRPCKKGSNPTSVMCVECVFPRPFADYNDFNSSSS